jgi:hypothetical protein
LSGIGGWGGGWGGGWWWLGRRKKIDEFFCVKNVKKSSKSSKWKDRVEDKDERGYSNWNIRKENSDEIMWGILS